MKHLIFRLLASVGLLSLPAAATPVVQDPLVGNVSSSSACIAWSFSETAKPGLEVFTDAAATQNVTNQVRIETQSLDNSRREVSSTAASRRANRDLQALMALKRVAFVRITGLAPATQYFLRPLALSTTDGLLASGPLTPVTTAATAAFVPESRQLIADLAAMVPTTGTVGGALLVAGHAQARYPLISVVGDGGSPSQAYFDLTLLLDAAGTKNLVPSAGSLALTLSWLGLPPVNGVFQPDSVPYTGATKVAASSTTAFVGQGYVVHAALGGSYAVAGLPFGLSFSVTDVSGVVQSGFNRPLIVNSPAISFGAGSTVPLNSGQLADHTVIFGSPGVKTVTVLDSGSTASTTIDVNVIQMSYQNWRDYHIGNALAGGGLGDNPDADPFPNFVEYVHGRSPARSDGAVLGALTAQPGKALTIHFDLNPQQSEYAVVIQVSPDLGTWHRSAKIPQAIQSLPGHDVMEVSWTAAELAAETGVNSPGYYARLTYEPATSFSSWLAANSLSGANADPAANPDGDPDPNFVEFALDSNPNSGSSSGKVRQTFGTFGGSVAQVLTLPMRLGASPPAWDPIGGELVFEVAGLRYRIQGSANLVSWNLDIQEVPAAASALPPLHSGYEYRSFRSPGSNFYAFEFVRVRIEQITP